MLRRLSAVPSRTCSRLLASPSTRIASSSTPLPLALRSLSSTSARMFTLPSITSPSSPITTSLPCEAFHLLAESDKSGPYEDALYFQQLKDVEIWWATPRYAGITRPYTAADVVSKRGSLQQSYPSSLMARKLWDLIQERLSRGEPIHTSTSHRCRPWIIHFRPDHALSLVQWVPSIPSR